MGAFLYLAYTAQTFGLVYTTPSKNAFLTSIYCVLVPFLYWWLAKQRPDRYNILAALLCVAGVGSGVPHWGLYHHRSAICSTLVSALFYALHIVAVNKLSPGKDVYLITVFQFAGTAVLSLVSAALFHALPRCYLLSGPGAAAACLFVRGVHHGGSAVPERGTGGLRSLLRLGDFVAGVRCSGVLFSVLFYGDPVTPRLMAGFALIFVAVICSETKFSFLRPKHSLSKEQPADSF